MSQFDLDAICKTYYNYYYRNEPYQRIDYNDLILRVHDIAWSEQTPRTDHKGATSIVTVKRDNPQLQAYGSVSTSRNNEFIVRLELLEGVAKGLTRRVRLPLPEKLHGALGSSVEVSINQAVSEVVNKLEISAQSQQEFPKHAREAQAKVTIKDSEYKGSFECSVSMKGKVVYPIRAGKTRSAYIGEIVEWYNEEGYMNIGLTVQRKAGEDSAKSRVVWKLKGSCDFRWMSSQDIEWTDKSH